MSENRVTVIGAGLAGSEAAWQLANRGVAVDLYEMRPVKSSPAHQTDQFAELVCSNSLRAGNIENAVGLLKEEMRRLGSLIMECADDLCVEKAGVAMEESVFIGDSIAHDVNGAQNVGMPVILYRPKEDTKEVSWLQTEKGRCPVITHFSQFFEAEKMLKEIK